MGERDSEVPLNSGGKPVDILGKDRLIQTELSPEFVTNLGRNSRRKIKGNRISGG
jgi:hypothetical protein